MEEYSVEMLVYHLMKANQFPLKTVLVCYTWELYLGIDLGIQVDKYSDGYLGNYFTLIRKLNLTYAYVLLYT